MLEIGSNEYTMSNYSVWEEKGTKSACRLCGQFIQNKEKYKLIVIPTEYRKEIGNFIVHADEWTAFTDGIEDVDTLIKKLMNTKQPRTKNATIVDEVVVTAFKKVLANRGYRIKKETKNRIYFKAYKKMACFYFDKRFKKFSFEGRANGLFDGLHLKELYSRLHEDLEKELGNDVKEGFRVSKAFNQAIETVNQLMK